jgi:hypothetical protein
MNPTRVASWSLAAILGAAALACGAQESGGPAARLTPQASGGISYLTGGVSLEERDAIREQANEYNLWIWLARTGSGYFLADVKVDIEDARGRPVLDTVTTGPWLLARVPAGRYTIHTDQSDAATTVNVGTTGHTVSVLRFPGPE